MALSRLDSLPSISVTYFLTWISLLCVSIFFALYFKVLDEENMAVPRGKNIVQPIDRINGGASLKPRAVLGDISSNRLALANIFKTEANEHDFKKPSGSGRPLSKKSTQEIEGYVAVLCNAFPSFKIVFSAIFSACSETVKPEPVTEVEARPRSFSSRNLEIVDIDTESNPQLVSSYVKDIYKYLNELEVWKEQS